MDFPPAPVTVCEVGHVERKVSTCFCWFVCVYQKFPGSQEDGDLLVFESAGSASQFRRFVAATVSWSEAGGQQLFPVGHVADLTFYD